MILPKRPRWQAFSVFLLVACLNVSDGLAEEIAKADPFEKRNLVAWCIVPFDAAKRGPKARAEMLERLGLRRCAYDWRAEHVPTFEAEIEAYAAHGIEFFAFWGAHEEAFRLFEKHALQPQIWQTAPSPKGDSQEQRVEAAVAALLPLARGTTSLGCQLGLYNHGGWGGEPANLIAVCRGLRKAVGSDRVGIVYNFHHGHDHLPRSRSPFRSCCPTSCV